MATKARLQVTLESGDFSCEGLTVRRVAGREAISEPFSFEVELAHRGEAVEGLLPGACVTIVLAHDDGEEQRRIHGMVAQIRDRLDAVKGARAYWMRVVPRAHRLTLIETQEIFMDLAVPDIIKQKLEQVGLAGDDVALRLHERHAPREFVVQYRETDFAFLGRLIEHLGVSYHFEHSAGHDQIVFSDHNGGFGQSAHDAAYAGTGATHDVFELEEQREMVPAMFVMQDYNYRTPLANLWASHSIDEGAGGVVEYGAHYKTQAEGAALARIRAEERRCRARVFHGKSASPGLQAGFRTRLTDHPILDSIDLLVTEVTHDLVVAEQGAGGSYHNSFQAIPAEVAYRPARRTPRPRITGLLTGMVRPAPGNHTGGRPWLDAMGRYMIEFHFDSSPGKDKASRPVRMAQPYIGPDHGMHFPLRPGAEVVIAFLDGDPDRPVILGAVPNAITPSPVHAGNADKNRLSTGSVGVLIEMSHKK